MGWVGRESSGQMVARKMYNTFSIINNVGAKVYSPLSMILKHILTKVGFWQLSNSQSYSYGG